LSIAIGLHTVVIADLRINVVMAVGLAVAR